MLAVLAFAAAALILAVALYVEYVNSLSEFSIGSIAIANRSWNVYIASTQAQQEEGYMHQYSIGNCNGKGNCLGMLFLMNGTQYVCMWMHDTPMPLYQYWIENGSIAYSYNGIPFSNRIVCHYGNAVLETQKLFQIGTSAEIENAT